MEDPRRWTISDGEPEVATGGGRSWSRVRPVQRNGVVGGNFNFNLDSFLLAVETLCVFSSAAIAIAFTRIWAESGHLRMRGWRRGGFAILAMKAERLISVMKVEKRRENGD